MNWALGEEKTYKEVLLQLLWPLRCCWYPPCVRVCICVTVGCYEKCGIKWWKPCSEPQVCSIQRSIFCFTHRTQTGFCLVESFCATEYWFLKFEFLQFLAINTSLPHLTTLNHLPWSRYPLGTRLYVLNDSLPQELPAHMVLLVSSGFPGLQTILPQIRAAATISFILPLLLPAAAILAPTN